MNGWTYIAAPWLSSAARKSWSLIPPSPLRPKTIWLGRGRASWSVNIAEGNGRHAGSDRLPFVDTAYTAALKSAVLIDLMMAKQEVPQKLATNGKRMLDRVASMLLALREYCDGTATA